MTLPFCCVNMHVTTKLAASPSTLSTASHQATSTACGSTWGCSGLLACYLQIIWIYSVKVTLVQIILSVSHFVK